MFFLKRKLWSLSNFFNVYTCIYENNERSGKSKNLSENKKIIKIFKSKKHSKYIYLLEVDIHLHSKDWENGKQGRINLLNASNILNVFKNNGSPAKFRQKRRKSDW